MTDQERYCTVYAVPTSKPFVLKSKPERKPIPPEVKARWDFIASHDFFIHSDENGNLYGEVTDKEPV